MHIADVAIVSEVTVYLKIQPLTLEHPIITSNLPLGHAQTPNVDAVGNGDNRPHLALPGYSCERPLRRKVAVHAINTVTRRLPPLSILPWL